MTDNDFSSLLREAAPEPPHSLAADDIVRAARRRGLTRISIAGTAVVAAAAAAVVVATDGNDMSTLVGTRPTPVPLNVEPCAASSLRPDVAEANVLSNGFIGYTITVTNRGRITCHLAERITSLVAAKTRVELPIEPTASDTGGPQDLAPGTTAAFTIESMRVSGGSGTCLRPAPPADATPPYLQFTLPGTGDLTVSVPSSDFTLGCWPIVVSRLFSSATPSTASPAPVTTGPFRATDVTFVSTSRGWAISPGRLMHTTDGGVTWSKLTAPPEYADHVRFANDRIGYAWATQKDLFITRDGGGSWQPTKLTMVLQLEAAAGAVWAIAGDEPYPRVWHGAVGAPSFTKIGQTPDRSGTLDVHGSTAYVVGEEGAGPIAGSIDTWTGLRRTNRLLPCKGKGLYIPDSPLGVSTDGTVFLVCDVERLVQDASPPPEQWAYVSSDRGSSWTHMPGPPERPTDVTATRNALFSWGKNIERYDGARWTVVLHGGGFATVGFQDDEHGVALGRDGTLHLTRDGGMSWTTATW